MKFTQISTCYDNNSSLPLIFALGEDGKVYQWTEEEFYDVEKDQWVCIESEDETILIEGKFNG